MGILSLGIPGNVIHPGTFLGGGISFESWLVGQDFLKMSVDLIGGVKWTKLS